MSRSIGRFFVVLLATLAAACGGRTELEPAQSTPSRSQPPEQRPQTERVTVLRIPRAETGIVIDESEERIVKGGVRIERSGAEIRFATDLFASPILAVSQSDEGWLFATDRGLTARSDTFMGPLTALGSISSRVRMLPARGRLLLVDDQHRAWTTDGSGPVRPIAALADYGVAGGCFRSQAAGTVVDLAGLVLTTDDGGASWVPTNDRDALDECGRTWTAVRGETETLISEAWDRRFEPTVLRPDGSARPRESDLPPPPEDCPYWRRRRLRGILWCREDAWVLDREARRWRPVGPIPRQRQVRWSTDDRHVLLETACNGEKGLCLLTAATGALRDVDAPVELLDIVGLAGGTMVVRWYELGERLRFSLVDVADGRTRRVEFPDVDGRYGVPKLLEDDVIMAVRSVRGEGTRQIPIAVVFEPFDGEGRTLALPPDTVDVAFQTSGFGIAVAEGARLYVYTDNTGWFEPPRPDGDDLAPLLCTRDYCMAGKFFVYRGEVRAPAYRLLSGDGARAQLSSFDCTPPGHHWATDPVFPMEWGATVVVDGGTIRWPRGDGGSSRARASPDLRNVTPSRRLRAVRPSRTLLLFRADREGPVYLARDGSTVIRTALESLPMAAAPLPDGRLSLLMSEDAPRLRVIDRNGRLTDAASEALTAYYHGPSRPRPSPDSSRLHRPSRSMIPHIAVADGRPVLAWTLYGRGGGAPTVRAMVMMGPGGRFAAEWHPTTLAPCRDDDPSAKLTLYPVGGSAFGARVDQSIPHLEVRVSETGDLCAESLHLVHDGEFVRLRPEGDGVWIGDGTRCRAVPSR